MAQRAGVCSLGVNLTSVRQIARLLIGAATFALVSPLPAAPVPHPDRPDRLVETRDGLEVEYSPGQEAWMEMAFTEMRRQAEQTATAPAAPAATRPGPARPGTAQHLQENRGVILAALARQGGLDRPTELQGRVFDTFLGYYRLASELMLTTRAIPTQLTTRRVAIWQRDDLVRRLRTGARIEGMTYDPETDSGNFNFNFNLSAESLGNRFGDLYAEIEAQQLKHRLNLDKDSYTASVHLGAAAAKPKPPAETTPAEPEEDLATRVARTVFPISYKEAGAAPTPDRFEFIPQVLSAMRTSFEQEAANYRDARMVAIILHETAETALVENIIASRDRRWLCDGTANYAAWRVTRDLIGADFATAVYDLDLQLRQHAPLQPQIDLAAWSAAEHQKEGDPETDLNRAHYTFATRAMFLLAERHGENALAQLWADVAKTPKKKVTAQTFASAYRKRFKADLGKLVRDAQQQPVPPKAASDHPGV